MINMNSLLNLSGGQWKGKSLLVLESINHKNKKPGRSVQVLPNGTHTKRSEAHRCQPRHVAMPHCGPAAHTTPWVRCRGSSTRHYLESIQGQLSLFCECKYTQEKLVLQKKNSVIPSNVVLGTLPRESNNLLSVKNHCHDNHPLQRTSECRLRYSWFIVKNFKNILECLFLGGWREWK